MSPESIKRRSDIIAASTEVLSNLPFTAGAESFIIGEDTSMQIGEAIAARDSRQLRTIIEPAMLTAVEDYESTTPYECVGQWNDAIQTIFGEDVSLQDMLEDQDSRTLLNLALVDSDQTQLGLDTTAYLKLLETLTILTMPSTGYEKHSTSKRDRTGGSSKAIFNRSITLLNKFASLEPGIRGIREEVLSGDTEALNHYLTAMITARDAQNSIEKILEMDEHDIRRQVTTITKDISGEGDIHNEEINDLLHTLSWTILPVERESRETKHKKIKSILTAQSTTEFQKRKLYADWCPERLDLLIELAELGIDQDRHPRMYISNRFENGSGVYVAVELSHPHNPDKSIVFADNPLAGNAIYMVDEVALDNNDMSRDWHDVLGASRRIARDRGATRKYHAGNWQDVIHTMMSMGATEQKKTQEPLEQPSSVVDDYERTMKLHRELMKLLK